MHKFFRSCVTWPFEAMEQDGLSDLITNNQEPITRRQFLARVDREEMKEQEQNLGYGRDFPMCRDWHVGYFKGTLYGVTVYGFAWSAIEHVFIPEDADMWEAREKYLETLAEA